MEKDIIKVDSCIIGGSIIGLWTALELAKKAQKVLVVDKDYIGFEKSNIDVCLNYNCVESMHKIALKAQKRWMEIKKDKKSADLIAQIRGSISVSLNSQEQQELETILAEHLKIDKDLGSFTIKDKQALKTLLKVKEIGEQVHSALISVEDLSLDHQNCLDFLRKQLIQNGAKFWGSDEVIDFELNDKTITGIITKESIIKADNIIIATGAMSKILLERLALKMPIRPARAHIIEYSTKVQMPKQIIHYKTKNGEYILKPLLNGRNHLIYTGLEDQMQATWSKDVNMQTVNNSMVEMMRILPILEYSDIQDHHITQLTVTPDRIPYFGKTNFYKNLFVCIGLHANNYLLSPYLAHEMANLVDKGIKNSELKKMNPDRFMDSNYKIDYKSISESTETLEKRSADFKNPKK